MDTERDVKIPKRILNTLLQSLGAGVVPRTGAPYIAIGRKEEVAAGLSDLENTKEGGSAVRFLIGRYGSGKSFLLQLLRGYALDRNFLTADCDLSPERRLSGGNGGGIATYRELLRNLASKAAPEGGALPTVLSRHYTKLCTALVNEGYTPETPEFVQELRRRVHTSLSELEDNVGGFDFARILCEYYAAVIADDEEHRSACLKWLRGEYTTKSEARSALGFSLMNTIITDENWYDFLKLWASFSRLLGYSGLFVIIDECVNLYKIPNRISREANYEKLLAIFNDTLQGRAAGLAVIFGGTPQFLEDTRRGLFSYEALRSRLADSRFTELGYHTLSSPVIRLRRLSDNELLALLNRLSRLFSTFYQIPEALTGDNMADFLRASLQKVGAEENLTPREMIRNFLALLAVLRENPEADAADLIRRFAGGSREESPETAIDEPLEESPMASPGVFPNKPEKKNIALADFDF